MKSLSEYIVEYSLDSYNPVKKVFRGVEYSVDRRLDWEHLFTKKMSKEDKEMFSKMKIFDRLSDIKDEMPKLRAQGVKYLTAFVPAMYNMDGKIVKNDFWKLEGLWTQDNFIDKHGPGFSSSVALISTQDGKIINIDHLEKEMARPDDWPKKPLRLD